MYLPVCLINLFCIPLLSLYTFCKRNGIPIRPSFRMVLCYGVQVPAVFSLTHVLLAAVRKIAHVEIPLDAAKYTLCALVSAFLLPYLYEFFRKYIQASCDIRKKETK